MRTTRSEARYTTQDGRIWPVTRDRMENPRHIGDRMVRRNGLPGYAKHIPRYVYFLAADAVVTVGFKRKPAYRPNYARRSATVELDGSIPIPGRFSPEQKLQKAFVADRSVKWFHRTTKNDKAMAGMEIGKFDVGSL